MDSASATYSTLTWHKKPRRRCLRCRQAQDECCLRKLELQTCSAPVRCAKKAHAKLGLGLLVVLHTHTPPHTEKHSILPIIHHTTVMGESRSELLAWANELLQINYTKIEQCGTGAAYCQILDSIYRTFSFNSSSRLGLWLWHLICLWGRSGYTNDARQNERKTRIRIYREFQSDAECVQGEADRQGAFSSLAYR